MYFGNFWYFLCIFWNFFKFTDLYIEKNVYFTEILKLCGIKYTINYNIFYILYLNYLENKIPLNTRSENKFTLNKKLIK